jgi:3-hydroxyacyl-CoA dehydrogenase
MSTHMKSLYEMRRSVAIVRLDSGPVNALGLALRQSVFERIETALRDPAVKGIVLTGSSAKAFSAGADIAEFGSLRANAHPSLNELIDRIEQAGIPVVAAVSGFALGGGMELALGCHYRVVAPSASFGLPEVKLGLIPGAGGTQRLPRIVGRETALDLIATGKTVDAATALAIGIADVVLEGDIAQSAAQWLEDGVTVRRTCDRPVPADQNPLVEPRVAANGYARPVQAIVRCVEAAGNVSFHIGMELERSLFSELVQRPESAALRHAFFAERRAASIGDLATSAAQPRKIRQVGVVGAGTMGGGIAMCFANAGFTVKLFDAMPASLDKGIASIRSAYADQQEKKRLTPGEAQRRFDLIHPVAVIEDIGDCDLVIEAVFEDLNVKRDVFQALDRVMKPGSILATNTSTLDVEVIAAFTARPADVLGLHFFSPATVMRLLEIVRGAATAHDVLVTALALAKRLGKTGVVAGICDGFIGNRMWHQYLRQAAQLVEDGASPQQVDSALEQWGFAMGPFRVADLAGLDVGYLIRQRQARDHPDTRWPAWLDAVSETGRLGQKSRLGIYQYTAGRRGGEQDDEVGQIIEASRARAGVTPATFSDEDIVRRCTHALIVEGARLLEEGIAQRGSDVDAVFLNGYGFPRHRGGPMFAADTFGLDAVLGTLAGYAERSDAGFWTAPAILRDLAARGDSLSSYQPALGKTVTEAA